MRYLLLAAGVPLKALGRVVSGSLGMIALGFGLMILAAAAAAVLALAGIACVVIGAPLQVRRLCAASAAPDAVNKMTIADQAWVSFFVRQAARAAQPGRAGRGPAVQDSPHLAT